MNDPYDNAIDDKAILAQLAGPGAEDALCAATSTTRRAESLLRRLEAGEDLEVLYQETLPPGERELLRRVALTRQFDEALVDEVLRPGVPGGSREEVPFARLIGALSVERWPRTNSYYMRDSGRRKWLRGSALTELRDVEARLTVYWERRGDEVEHLYHLLAVDPAAARESFCALYEAASCAELSCFCYDLIRALRERSSLLSPELTRLLEEKEAHLRVHQEECHKRHSACLLDLPSNEEQQ